MMTAPIEVHSTSLRAVVSLELSADHWQLYDMPGRDQAAAGLNRAIEALLAEGAPPARIYAALSRPGFREYGASDSEGYSVAAGILLAVGYREADI